MQSPVGETRDALDCRRPPGMFFHCQDFTTDYVSKCRCLLQLFMQLDSDEALHSHTPTKRITRLIHWSIHTTRTGQRQGAQRTCHPEREQQECGFVLYSCPDLHIFSIFIHKNNMNCNSKEFNYKIINLTFNKWSLLVVN